MWVDETADSCQPSAIVSVQKSITVDGLHLREPTRPFAAQRPSIITVMSTAVQFLKYAAGGDF